MTALVSGSTPLGTEIIDALVLSALDDLQGSQRHHRNLRHRELADLFESFDIIGVLDFNVLIDIAVMRCVQLGIIGILASSQLPQEFGVIRRSGCYNARS